jgi:single-strand DNA-binding protein
LTLAAGSTGMSEVAMNIVILSGLLSSAPRRTELPSGTVRWNLEVSCPDPTGRLLGVPVSWEGHVSDAWATGTPVVVAGTVRRRFFRTSVGTQSRTEVVAASVVEITRRRNESSAVIRAVRFLGADVVAGLRSLLGAPSVA